MSADPLETVLVVVIPVTSDMPIDTKQVPGLDQLSGIPENPAGCNLPSRKLVCSFSHSLTQGLFLKLGISKLRYARQDGARRKPHSVLGAD